MTEPTFELVSFGPQRTYIAIDNAGEVYTQLPQKRQYETLIKELRNNSVKSCSLGSNDQYFASFYDARPIYCIDGRSHLAYSVKNRDVTDVVLGTNNSYFAHLKGSVNHSGLPKTLQDRLRADFGSGQHVATMAFADGSYFVQFDDYSFWASRDVPRELLNVVRANGVVTNVGLRPNFSEWYVRCANGAEAWDSEDLDELYRDIGPQLTTMNPRDILYTNSSISQYLQDGWHVNDLIDEIGRGNVSPRDIEPIRVVFWRGRYRSLDNRRLFCFQQAGCKQIPVQIVEDLLSPEKKKSWMENDMSSVYVRDAPA